MSKGICSRCGKPEFKTFCPTCLAHVRRRHARWSKHANGEQHGKPTKRIIDKNRVTYSLNDDCRIQGYNYSTRLSQGFGMVNYD